MRRRQPPSNGSKVEVTQEAKVNQLPSKEMRSLKRRLLKFVVFLLIVLYVIIPLLFLYSPTVRRHAVFLNYVSLYPNGNLSSPEDFGLPCSTNFYLPSEDKVQLGVWHIPPASSLERCKEMKLHNGKEFSDGRPVILYLHGNAGTRGGDHRVQLYKLLSSSKTDAHVIAFDYRGYGDSTNIPPSVDGLVKDADAVYKWIKNYVPKSHIFVWGHSLGTGVAVSFLEMLTRRNDIPAALILESPFTKIIDAARHHPISLLHRYMPFFDFFFSNSLSSRETDFNSIGKISKLTLPFMILHAKDDTFVPFNLGKKLYEKAKSERPSHLQPPQFVEYSADLGYGHKYIYKSPELPDVVLRFMKSSNRSDVKM